MHSQSLMKLLLGPQERTQLEENHLPNTNPKIVMNNFSSPTLRTTTRAGAHNRRAGR